MRSAWPRNSKDTSGSRLGDPKRLLCLRQKWGETNRPLLFFFALRTLVFDNRIEQRF
jgi:hypothetical protein